MNLAIRFEFEMRRGGTGRARFAPGIGRVLRHRIGDGGD